MICSRITNNSEKEVIIKTAKGTQIVLPPNCGVLNSDVKNLDEIKGQVEIVSDLTEVKSSPGKQRLDG